MRQPANLSCIRATVTALLGLLGGTAGGATLEIGDLPETLRDSAGLAFWVDANRNVATDESGSVTAWYDAREASGGTVYPRARQFGSELLPTLVTGGDDVAGNKLVDFGTFSCGKWLQWQDAAGNRYAIGNIRTVFMAISCTNGTGFLLGDANGYDPGGAYCFHVGNTGTNGLETMWFQDNGGGDDHPVRYGFARVNGAMIDGMHQRVPHVGTVVSMQTAWNVLASNFCNDRNLRDGVWGVTPGRLGGGRIGEVLVYTSELSDGQRRQVEDYLMRKWLRKPLETVSVPAGSTLSMSATNALDLTTVTGEGTLEVIGEGHIKLPDAANIAVPPVFLDAGGSAGGTLCRKAAQPFVLAGGASYHAATGVCTRTALADATAAEKTGSGALTVASVAPGAARINVTEGALRLSPPLPGTPDVLAGALQNGSFEDSPPGRPPEGSGLVYIENQTYAGWTYIWGAPGGNCGLARNGGAFCNRQPPDGDWVLFLVNDCSVLTTFTVPLTGRYEISFDTATGANAGWPWHVYQVLVDGTNVVGSIRTSETIFQHVTCRTPLLAAGPHTLRFLGIKEPDQNRVSLVDNVEVRPSVEADEVEVPNGGFEAPTLLTDISSPDRPYAYFQHEPADAGWTFTGAYAGTTEGYSTWHCNGMKEGGHAAVLNMYNDGGLMSVPITFPTGGVYRITFLAASRTARYTSLYNRWDDGAALNGNTFSVTLNGVEAARPTQPSWLGDFTAYEFTLPPVADGALTQTLAFQVINTEWFVTVLIDDVRIFKMPPIANPGFEDVSEAGQVWTFNRGSVECGITTPGEYSWTVTSPEGARCLVMANDGGASQSVTFETDGIYELSFLAAQSPSTAPGHEFAVTFGGMQIGSVRSESTTFQRCAFRLPYVKAGQAYGLTLQGLTPGGTWYASLIDSVILKKIDVEPVTFGAQTFASTYVGLSADTTLELDYDGTVELDGLAYGGVPYVGTRSAANTPFIRGAGSVLVKPKGTLLKLR